MPNPLHGLRSLFSKTTVTRWAGVADEIVINDMDTAQLYRTQPNLRSVVTFLADNAAMIPWKVYDRESETDRPRVRDSVAAKLLAHPNPWTTPYELRRGTFSDLYLYDRCVWLVMRDASSDSGWCIVRIPPTWITGYEGENPFEPDSIIVVTKNSNGLGVQVDRKNFILFHGYNPRDPRYQTSPVAALKDTLHEQVESNAFRRQMWKRGGRFNSYVVRPKEVQPLDNDAMERLKTTFRDSWAGDNAAEGGGMPIMEDGMEIRQMQFNSRDAQWADAKKLGREDVAGVYHVNPSLIWPGSGQTYASAKDNARALYNDTLATKITEVVSRVDSFLLPMLDEEPTHYVEYDLTVKTQGSFEEMVSTMSTATGRPFMSVNEARAKLNMPAMEGGDELIVPMNVTVGGLASPHDTDPTAMRYEYAPEEKSETKRYKAEPDSTDTLEEVFKDFFTRQEKSVLAKLGAKADWWDSKRWDKELADDLEGVSLEMSTASAKATLKGLGIDASGFSESKTRAYIRKMCEMRAKAVNDSTKEHIEKALHSDGDGKMDTPQGVFENAREHRAESCALAMGCALSAWGAEEAMRQTETPGMKTWVCTSVDNPRESHRQMHGETVPVGQPFSNGAMHPGDWGALDASEIVNCHCEVEITYEG